MSGKIILGIDPGRSGAVAAHERVVGEMPGSVHIVRNLYEGGKATAAVWLTLLAEDARANGTRVVAYIEQPPDYVPDENSCSTSKLNDSFGYWKGVCEVLGIEVRLVRPQEWQARMLAYPECAGRRMSGKEAARVVIPKYFPGLHAAILEGRKVARQDRYDAGGILIYGIEHDRLPDVLRPKR